MTLFGAGESAGEAADTSVASGVDPDSQLAARLRTILDSGSDAFVGMDSEGRITEWSRSAADLFGWSRDEATGCSVSQLIIPPDLREAHERGVRRLVETGVATVLGIPQETRGMHRNGSEIPIELTRWRLDVEGTVAFYAFIRDIRLRRRIEYRAAHDSLTGLNNRSSLVTHLEGLLRGGVVDPAPGDADLSDGGLRGSESGDPEGSALVLIDLDGFRRVNEVAGRGNGDRVLQMLADRLRDDAGLEAVVARLSGDQFAVLLGSRLGAADLRRRVTDLADHLVRPVLISGHLVTVDASIGVVHIGADRSDPRYSRDVETTWREAESALRSAKRVAGTRVEIYDDSLRERAIARQARAEEFEVAISRGELELHLQPVFDPVSRTPTAAEALLRWRHPGLGLIFPDQFIDLAEEFGFAEQLAYWVFDAALALLARGRLRGLSLAVNLSATQLALPDLVDRLEFLAAEAGVPLAEGRLSVEVTESVFIDDPDRAAATLRRLREIGVAVALDDFGTGFSSLAYLRHLPADALKIDRSFVAGLPDSRTDRAIVTATVQLARSLDIDVIAEGVETEEQLSALVEMGCGLVQGYLLARPVPVDAFEALLGAPAH